MKKLRLLLITLCVSVLMGSMAVTAYAGGGEEWDGLAPVEPLPTETVDPGEGFTEDGNLVTRDLLYDKATNKQFITVQTSGGNTFYIVIDYDKPTDEDGEQYHTYFLNMVDEADLLAAMQAAGGELPDQLADEGRRQQHRPGLHRLPQRTDGEIRRPFENIQDRGRRIGLRRRTVVFQRLAGLAGQRICQRVDLQDLSFLLQNVRGRDRQRERRQQQ